MGRIINLRNGVIKTTATPSKVRLVANSSAQLIDTESTQAEPELIGQSHDIGAEEESLREMRLTREQFVEVQEMLSSMQDDPNLSHEVRQVVERSLQSLARVQRQLVELDLAAINH